MKKILKILFKNMLINITCGQGHRLQFINTVGYATTNDATTNSSYQWNQDATTNTDATRNAEEYYRPK
jgi:hypothetical protein